MRLILTKITLSIILLSFSSTVLSGQSDTEAEFELAHFRITISTEGNTFKFACDHGCYWKELTYSYDDVSRKGLITQEGFFEYEGQTVNDDSITDFGFTTAREGEMIVMEGLVGTAWLSQSFTLRDGEEQIFNELGGTR